MGHHRRRAREAARRGAHARDKKRERAEEKERLEREQNVNAQLAREEQIATANPLLNLAAALGQKTGVNTTAPGTFAVKRRWDDGACRLVPTA